MQIFLTLAFLFFLGATIGWICELIFRRFAHGKWINPGFLKGPYLPIYGLGLVALFFLCRLIDWVNISVWWGKLLLCIALSAGVMTLIEYIAGIIFIKGMKIKLWDYSNRWGNIQGIICPLFTLIWAVVGVGYFYLLDLHILNAVSWLFKNLAFSFVVGLFFGVFFVDLATCLKVTVKISKYAKQHNLVVRYEKFKESVYDHLKEIKEKRSFINLLRTREPLENSLERYIKAEKDKNQEDIQS